MVLRDLCRALPRTRKQLAAVEGMGVFKANRYGDQILQVIGRYAPEAKPEKSMSSAKTRKESGKAASDIPKRRPVNRLLCIYRL